MSSVETISPLTAAAKADAFSTVVALLKARADANESSPPFGWTALHNAAGCGAIRAAEALLAGRANINSRSADTETPLHIAAAEGQESMTHFLIYNRADIFARNEDGETPLHVAVQHVGSKSLGHISALLQAKADPSRCDSEGNDSIAHAKVYTNRAAELEAFLSRELSTSTPVVLSSFASDAEESAKVTREELRQRGVRPNQPSYHETPLITIGKQVRVRNLGPGAAVELSRRAEIDCIDEGQGTIDVVYVKPKGFCSCSDVKRLDEETVPIASVSTLEDFELVNETTRREAFKNDLYATAMSLKENGNELFKLKDYEAAIEYYSIAILALREARPHNLDRECSVLANHGGALVLGFARVSDVLAATNQPEMVEVRLSGPDGGPPSQVVKVVPWRALILVHERQLLLHSSLYMNRSKSFTQLGCHQEAAQDLSIVIALWEVAGQGPDVVANCKEQLTKAHYLRAKARLARMRIGPARADIKEAWAHEPSEATARVLRQLEREVDAAQREQTRSNKRLAKEIAKFAGSAMQMLDPSALEAMDAALPE